MFGLPISDPVLSSPNNIFHPWPIPPKLPSGEPRYVAPEMLWKYYWPWKWYFLVWVDLLRTQSLESLSFPRNMESQEITGALVLRHYRPEIPAFSPSWNCRTHPRLLGGEPSGEVVLRWNSWSAWGNAVQIGTKSEFIQICCLCQRNRKMGNKQSSEIKVTNHSLFFFFFDVFVFFRICRRICSILFLNRVLFFWMTNDLGCTDEQETVLKKSTCHVNGSRHDEADTVLKTTTTPLKCCPDWQASAWSQFFHIRRIFEWNS
jgi:hypothetical protein